MDVQCTAGYQPGSWIWYYDIVQDQSAALAPDAGCNIFPSQESLWSDDGQPCVVESEASMMLVSVDGKVTRLPVAAHVVGKLTIP